ncbi:MAG: Wzz/FepE/Etk N-terminal domain-containing protein [Crocinitomicaceae bacterium]
MNETNPMETFNQERQNLLLFVWKKRKVLILTSGITAIVAIVISLMMKPLFLSTAIVFPTATSTVSFSEQRNAKASSMDFGEEDQAEQLVQILQSSRIRNRVIQRFDLMKHYDIDPNDKNRNYKLMKEYDGHIRFTRTKYGSIQIDVLDEQPELAAEIANKIVDLIDTVKNNMVLERTVPAFEVNLRKKQLLEKDLQNVLIQLDSLADMGVISIEGRTNLYTAYIEAKTSADRQFLKQQIDVNLKYGAKFDGLEQMRDEKIVKMEKFLDSYEQAESDAYANFTHKFIVERAVKADKKDKPKRMIIVLLAVIGSFVFMVFALLINERIKELKKAA